MASLCHTDSADNSILFKTNLYFVFYFLSSSVFPMQIPSCNACHFPRSCCNRITRFHCFQNKSALCYQLFRFFINILINKYILCHFCQIKIGILLLQSPFPLSVCKRIDPSTEFFHCTHPDIRHIFFLFHCKKDCCHMLTIMSIPGIRTIAGKLRMHPVAEIYCHMIVLRSNYIRLISGSSML